MPVGEKTALEGRNNRWKRARERDRIHARFVIRDRVLNDGKHDEEGETTPSSLMVSTKTNYLEEEIRPFLKEIANGNSSFFSLSNVSKHHVLLQSRIPSNLLSEYKINTLCTSRFGPQRATLVHQYCFSRPSTTMMEYACLLGEYRIVASMIIAGVDPTAVPDPLLGQRVLKRFFTGVPLPLSTYAVKRLVDFRLLGWHRNHQTHIHTHTHTHHNLSFDGPCQHVFQETLFWDHFIQNLDQRDGDIIICPLCSTSTTHSHSQLKLKLKLKQKQKQKQKHNTLADLTPSQKRQISFHRFCQLPQTSHELKKLSKRRKPKSALLASSWSQAIIPSLGSSQDVRRDKLLAHTLLGNFRFVQGCLEHGVDVNVTNEYGQTALYIASLQGHATILQLLLSYGADQSIAAFGGSTPWSVAEANKHHTVTNLLSLPDSHPTMVLSMKDSLDQFSFPFPNEGKTLIGNNIHHPGAGSYTIDDALPTASIQKIKTMWSTLPKDSTAKKKEKCSTRYYFCDGEKYICRALAQSIQHALPDQYAMVFPRMRFLHYTDEGSVLAPHVDLSHTENGLRSTHTFILYLTTCENGGETTLLQSIQSEFDILAQVSPVMGRLLLFPHTCPHMGSQVHDEKLILRGEVILSLTAI